MPPGQLIVVEQNADVQDRLSSVTAGDLRSATDASGNPLLNPDAQADAEALAESIRRCMSLAGASSRETARRLDPKYRGTGVWCCASRLAEDLDRIDPRIVPEQHWHLSFADGKIVYKELTAEQAEALIDIWMVTLPLAKRNTGRFFGSIFDFLEGVVSGVIDVINIVVTTVVNAVEAAFTFILNGIEQVFNWVIEVVDQAIAVVETIFAKIEVFFQTLFEWLGFIFAWPDILRTRDALVHIGNETLGFLQGSADGLKRLIDRNIATLQSRVQEIFTHAIQDIAGNHTIGGYAEANEPPSPQFASALSNNVVFNALIDNASSAATSMTTPALDDRSDILAPVVRAIEEFVGNTEMNQAFQQAKTYFTTLGGSPDEIFNQLLSGLLSVVQGVVQAALAGAKAIADALLGIISALVEALRGMLNTEWRIPLVSEIFFHVSGESTLTTLNLIALIAAIPTTVVYKLVFSRVPFEDPASVAAFRSSFNAQRMLEAVGLPSSRSDQEALGEPRALDLPEPVRRFLAICNAMGTAVNGFVNAGIDIIPPPVPSPPVLTRTSLVLSTVTQMCTIPSLFTGSNAFNCDTSAGRGQWLWVYGLLGLDMSIFFELTGARFAPDVAPICWTIYGAVNLALAISASVGEDGATVVANILPTFPWIGKLLRVVAIVGATGGISLIVLGALDTVCPGIAAIISFNAAIEDTVAAALTATSIASLPTNKDGGLSC